MAVDDHRGGVPDERDVDARHVDVYRARVIVRGDDGDALARVVLGAETLERHARLGGARAPVHGVLRAVRHPATLMRTRSGGLAVRYAAQRRGDGDAGRVETHLAPR